MAEGKGEEFECRLLALPPELSTIVYEMALEDTIIEITGFMSIKAPALLLTCKQINREATPLYYGICDFRSSHWPNIMLWLSRVPKDSRSQVRRISITGGSDATPAEQFIDDVTTPHHAQINLFAVSDTLNSGVIDGSLKSETVNLRALVRTSSTTSVLTPTPFLTWKDAYKKAHKSNPTWRTTVMLGCMEQHARFFEYNHVSEPKCWDFDWATDEDYECGCPKKEQEEAEK